MAQGNYDPNVTDVDKLEGIRLHEAAETERKLISERELTKREELKQRDTGGFIAGRVGMIIVGVGAIIAIAISANSYIDKIPPGGARSPIVLEPAKIITPPAPEKMKCADEFWRVSGAQAYMHASCSHETHQARTEHMIGNGEPMDIMFCLCPGNPMAKAPEPTPAVPAPTPTATTEKK
jgi:hypothetical protein